MKKAILSCELSEDIVELLNECSQRTNESVGDIVEKAVLQYMGGRPNFRNIIERLLEENAEALKKAKK